MTLHSTAWLTPFIHLHHFPPTTMTPHAPTTPDRSQQLKAFCSAAAQRNYGHDAERLCRGLAIAIAFSYAAGYALGCWLHQTKDQLSRFTAQFREPDWHQQRLAALKARLVVHQTSNGDPQEAQPQPASPLTDAPQEAQPQEAQPQEASPQEALPEPEPARTTRSKLPKPAAKPSRKRTARGAAATSPA